MFVKARASVVLRTFSKAHGLAGLRVGYGLGPAELLGYCARMRNTFSVSSVAQAAAAAALDDYLHIQRVVENNAQQSRVLSQGLSALGYRVVPTAANFLFCDLGEERRTCRKSFAGCKEWRCVRWGIGERRIAFA